MYLPGPPGVRQFTGIMTGYNRSQQAIGKSYIKESNTKNSMLNRGGVEADNLSSQVKKIPDKLSDNSQVSALSYLINEDDDSVVQTNLRRMLETSRGPYRDKYSIARMEEQAKFNNLYLDFEIKKLAKDPNGYQKGVNLFTQIVNNYNHFTSSEQVGGILVNNQVLGSQAQRCKILTNAGFRDLLKFLDQSYQKQGGDGNFVASYYNDLTQEISNLTKNSNMNNLPNMKLTVCQEALSRFKDFTLDIIKGVHPFGKQQGVLNTGINRTAAKFLFHLFTSRQIKNYYKEHNPSAYNSARFENYLNKYHAEYTKFQTAVHNTEQEVILEDMFTNPLDTLEDNSISKDNLDSEISLKKNVSENNSAPVISRNILHEEGQGLDFTEKVYASDTGKKFANKLII